MIFPHVPPAIFRLRVKPAEPAEGPPAVECERRWSGGRASVRLHNDLAVQAVRRLIEQTTLTYREIEARTGAGHSSIGRWRREFGWQRPAHAPRGTDTVPLWRAGQKLKLRRMAGRLLAIAERMTRELEDTPGVDLDKLVQALQVMKMARTAAMGNRRRLPAIGPARTGWQTMTEDEAIRTALKEMRRGGVALDLAPQEAMDLVIEANTPEEKDHPALHPRGWKRKRRR